MYFEFYIVFVLQVTGKCFCCIYTSMLTSCTSKIHLQICKATTNIIFHYNVQHVVHAVQEICHPGSLLQEIFHLFVPSSICLVFFEPARIQDATAIKYKASSMP